MNPKPRSYFWFAGALLLFGANALAQTDLNHDGIGVRNAGADVDPMVVVDDAGRRAIDLAANRVAFTFPTRSRNNPLQPPLNWAFPVLERAATPWVVANRPNTPAGDGFSGWPEGYHHEHHTALPGPPGAHDHVGPHPHIQMFVFKQRPDPAGGFLKPQMIGFSDLKHTFATKHAEPGQSGQTTSHHYAHAGEPDTYNEHSNRDRDFLGPMSEIDFTTFSVRDHAHFSDGAAPVVDANGYRVYTRGHGDKEHPGVAAIFDHRLLVNNIRELLYDDQRVNGMPGLNPDGTLWYFASSYLVANDTNLEDNTVFRRFDPRWNGPRDGATNGTDFAPIWADVSMRWSTVDNTMFVPIDQPGRFQVPVPEPGTAGLFVVALMAFAGRRQFERA